jgi:hypothetical protein
VEHGTRRDLFQPAIPLEQEPYQWVSVVHVPPFVPLEQGGTKARLFQGAGQCEGREDEGPATIGDEGKPRSRSGVT